VGYEDGPVIDMPPVTDWVNDWDWLDPQWGPHAIEIWDSVRAQCPVATTERYGRAHMPVTMAAVEQIARDTDHFSSHRPSLALPGSPRRPRPPITSDPPLHHGHRRLLLPTFSPKQIAPMEDDLRQFCRRLIDALDGASQADAAEGYSQHVPVHGICRLLGVPENDAGMFREWIFRHFQVGPRNNEVRAQLNEEMDDYCRSWLDTRRADPQDDLLTVIAHGEIDGEPIDPELGVGYVTLMIIAGIDTTWSSIGSGLWHFAQHPDQRERLAAAPDDDLLWQTAIEEVLRYYAPVTMAREIVADTEIAGCPVRAGEQTLVTFPAANHDPEAFETAHEFRIDRAVNRHVAFGLGIHRCVGSNLARLELRVAIQEWLRAFPDYELDPTQQTTWANGQVRGPRTIPVLLHRQD
jgi:cytochrome P450